MAGGQGTLENRDRPDQYQGWRGRMRRAERVGCPREGTGDAFGVEGRGAPMSPVGLKYSRFSRLLKTRGAWGDALRGENASPESRPNELHLFGVWKSGFRTGI